MHAAGRSAARRTAPDKPRIKPWRSCTGGSYAGDPPRGSTTSFASAGSRGGGGRGHLNGRRGRGRGGGVRIVGRRRERLGVGAGADLVDLEGRRVHIGGHFGLHGPAEQVHH